MAGFFLLGGGQGGGGGANPNQNAFVQVRFEPATNRLIFTNANGVDIPVSLADIRPDIIQGVIKDIDIVNKELVIEDIDNQVTTIPLTKVLDAVDINFAPTPDIQSTDVQGAIVEVNDKVGDAYNDSEYDEANGKLILKKPNGQEDGYRLANLDVENEFTKINVMPDLLLSGVTYDNRNYGGTKSPTGGRHFGIKSQSSSLFNDGFVECIRIYIHSITQGINTINGVRLWSVDKETNNYVEEIQIAQPINVIDDGGVKFIDIPVNKQFNKDTYFVYFLPSNQNYKFTAISGVIQYRDDYVNTDVVPVVGQQAPQQAINGYSIYAEIRGRISVEDKLMSSYTDSSYDAQTGKLTLTRHDGTTTTHTLSVGGGTVTNVEYRSIDNKLIVTKDAQTPPVEYDLSNLLGVREFAYDDNTQKITVLDHNNAPVEVDLNVFARLDRDNLFLGHNTFNEVFLLGKTPFIQTVGNVQNTGHNVNVHCGFREISTHFGQQAPLTPKYVSAIKIAIYDAEVGDVVDGVYITEIKKVNNRQDDIVGNKIVSNSSFIVEEDNEYQKCIYVPIQKSYDEDTYFLIGKVGGKVLNETWYRDSSKYTEFINGYPINQLPQTGDTLKSDKGIGYVVMHSLVEDDINVREELKRLDDYVPKSDLTTVGGQGNADKVPQLGNDGKIDISMIPNLSLNNTHVVRDEQEALQLIDGGTVNIGDVFILTDNQNSVHMYVDQAGLGFDDKCVELTMSNGAIVSVNKTYADATGNINLSLEVNGDNLEFKVNNVNINTLSLYTDTEANDLIATFV